MKCQYVSPSKIIKYTQIHENKSKKVNDVKANIEIGRCLLEKDEEGNYRYRTQKS